MIVKGAKTLSKAKPCNAEFFGEFPTLKAVEMLLRIKAEREGMQLVPGTLEIKRGDRNWEPTNMDNNLLNAQKNN